MVAVTKGVMALGEYQVPFTYSPDLLDLLRRLRHLLFFDADGTELLDACVITKVVRSRNAIVVTGRSPEWWLGDGGIGALIEDRRYVAGTNRLGNGSFELGDLLWRLAQGTNWAIIPSTNARTGSWCAFLGLGDPTKDDVLQSDESFECRPGDQYNAGAYFVQPLGTPVARLRIRTVYEGSFSHLNLFPSLGSGDAWDVDSQVTNNPQATEDAFEIVDGGGGILVLRGRTPDPPYQLVTNPYFADGLDGWVVTNGDWVASGPVAPFLLESVYIDGGGFTKSNITLNVTPGTANVLHDAGTGTFTTLNIGMLVKGNGIPPYTYIGGYVGPNDLLMSQDATAAATGVMVTFELQGTPRKRLHTDAVTEGTIPEEPTGYTGIVKGDVWHCSAGVLVSDDANGTASVYVRKTKTATDTALAGAYDEQVGSVTTGGDLVLSTTYTSPVKRLDKNVTIAEEDTAIGVTLEVEGQSMGRWWFTNILLQRNQGNKDSIPGATMACTPERTYKFTLPVQSTDLLVDEAVARLVVTLTGAGRPDKVLTVEQKRTDGKLIFVTLDVTPPSGYDSMRADTEIQDVFNDWFYFGEMTVQDQDAATYVVDNVISPPQPVYAGTGQVTTAPDGAERVRLELVGEAGGIGWVVDDAYLVRSGVTPDTVGAIVEALLLDPDTGLSPCLVPGTIHGDDVIQFDWHLRNLTNRDALIHLARGGVALPYREWRVNPDFTLDFGTAEQLFVDHTDLIFTRDSFFVLGDLAQAESTEDQVTRVKVIGAERQGPSRQKVVITGEATVAGDGGLDRFNNPVRRTLLIQDATVDHPVYAAALAQYHADRLGAAQQAVTIRLSDPTELDPINGGDWVYVYDAEAGIEDLTNEMWLDGEAVYPRRLRVRFSTRSYGSNMRTIKVLVPGEAEPVAIASTDVLWADATLVDLELGDILPDFTADPQGGNAGVQFLRDRASSPR